jgi:hypothetical protein
MNYIATFLLILSCSSYYRITGQIHKSTNYGYQIEIPISYVKAQATGKNVDFKVVDQFGNSIIIVVKKLPIDALNSSVYELAEITNIEWEQSLSEFLPNPKFVKSGKSKLDNKEAFWIHYTSQALYEESVIHINYMVFFRGLQYTITATCDLNDLDKNMPTFMRAIQSIAF